MLISLIHRAFAFLSLIVLAAGAYFAWSWWRLYESLEPPPGVAADAEIWRLWLAAALIAISFLGRTPMLWLLGRRGQDGERFRRGPGQILRTPTGAQLWVAQDGPPEAPTLVFVHGWGMEAGVWWNARRDLADRFGMLVYDLAGLGRSKLPPDGRVALERFADDLAGVVAEVGPRQVILVGHSIGGMTVLTFCRRHPELLGRQVAGIVLENTTADSPARTTILGEALFATRPVLRPLMRLDVWLQPLVWAMHWQAYLSGATHLAMRLAAFGVRPTRALLDQVARAATRNSPAVLAKGNLAMLDWRIEDQLDEIRVPALVFIGGRDLVTIPRAGEAIAQGLPDARAHRRPEAGHMGPLELAEAYDGVLAAFADEAFARGAQSADGRLREPGPASPSAPRPRPPGEPRPFA